MGGMVTNSPRFAQLGDQLNRLAPGGTLTGEFRVFKEFFGEADDAAAEQKAKAFASEHHCTFRYHAEQGRGIFKRVGPRRG